MNSSCTIDAQAANCQDRAYLVENKYRLVLKDAFWVSKDGSKIRFIPHQKKKQLKLVFAKVVDNNKGKSENELSFKLKFEIPGTIFRAQEMTINFSDMREMYCIKNRKISYLLDRDGNQYYSYFIRDFSSDLANVQFDSESAP